MNKHLDDSLIVDLYVKQNYNAYEIADMLHVSYDCIYKHLYKNGVKCRSISNIRSKNFDMTYFETIDAEHKAYWLGLIYADGCVSGKYFSLGLKAEDKYLLEALKKDLKSEHMIHNHQKKLNEKIFYSHVFSICNETLISQLNDLGVYENKTQNCKFPTNKIIPDKYLWDFIRGYMDGDGCITYKKNKHITDNNLNISISIGFAGTYDFINTLNNIISNNTCSNVKLYKNSNIYTVNYRNKKAIEFMYHKMYDNATIYMKRKKERLDKFIDEGHITSIIMTQEEYNTLKY